MSSMRQDLGIWMTALTCVLLLSGCGKESTPNADGESGETAETGETTGDMPDPHAVAECEAMFACECSERPFASLEACIEIRTGQLAALATVAAERGLTWDPACAQARVDRLTAACDLSFYLHAAQTCQGAWCPLYVGDKAVGAECDELGRAELISECGQGSICTAPLARCEEYCPVAADGEACNPDPDGYQGPHCPDGLQCLWSDASSFCGTPPGLGDACSNDLNPICGEGGFVCAGKCSPEFACDGEICQPRPAAGEPCLLGQCAEDAYCEVETCVQAKPTGEACTVHLECQTGLCLDSSCTELPNQGELCGESGICAEGLSCAGFDGNSTCEPTVPHACVIAQNSCTVEYNGVCDSIGFSEDGVCELQDEDFYDCGNCVYNPGVCLEETGACPLGSDPDC
jgi:hypothetical protein